MSNVVHMRNARDAKYYDQKLTELRVNDVENIIARGRLLIEMKDTLEHGEFENTVAKHFTPQTARKLIAIARHPIISNRAHGRDLPASWRTLYELTQLDDDVLRRALRDGRIHPNMERSAVMALRDEVAMDDTLKHKLEEAIKAEPNANQRDAAKALGVSIGAAANVTRRQIARMRAICRLVTFATGVSKTPQIMPSGPR